MADLKLVPYLNFEEGKNTYFPAWTIPDNAVKEAYNTRYERGKWFTRGGITQINDTAASGNAVTSMFRWYKDASTKFTLWASGVKLYFLEETTDELLEIKTGLTTGKRLRFCDAEGVLYCCNGTDNNFYINNYATTLNGALTNDTQGNNAQATSIDVTSILGFPTSGTIFIGGEGITYTNITSTTLAGALADDTQGNNAQATSIDITDASAFDSSGTIFIGNEGITYTGKSTNKLTGCTRGAVGTREAHSNLAVTYRGRLTTIARGAYGTRAAHSTLATVYCFKSTDFSTDVKFDNLIWHLNRLRGYKNHVTSGLPQPAVYWSDVNIADANSLDDNVSPVSIPNSETIQNWVVWQGIILMFTQNMIYQWTGTSAEETFDIRSRYDGVGTSSPDSVVKLQGGVAFINTSDSFLHLYNGTTSQILGFNQQDDYKRINNDYIDKVFCFVRDNKIHTVAPLDSATAPDYCLVYDLLNGRDYLDHGYSPVASVVYDREKTAGKEKTYIADSSGYLYRYDFGTSDDGVAIDAYFITKSYEWGRFDLNKDWRSFRLHGRSTTTNLTITYDLDGANTFAGTVTLDSDNKFYFAAYSHDIAFKFRNAVLDSVMSVYGFILGGHAKYIGGER